MAKKPTKPSSPAPKSKAKDLAPDVSKAVKGGLSSKEQAGKSSKESLQK